MHAWRFMCVTSVRQCEYALSCSVIGDVSSPLLLVHLELEHNLHLSFILCVGLQPPQHCLLLYLQ